MKKYWLNYIGVVAVLGILTLPLTAAGAGGGPPVTPPGHGQGPSPPQAPGPPPTATPDPAKVIVTGRGVITNVLADYGAEYPAILFTSSAFLNPIIVRLAPLWFMEQELGLSVPVLVGLIGKEADLVALEKTTSEDVVYHAITLTLTSDGTVYRFRTDDGKPLWKGSAKKPKGRDTTSATLVEGSVRDISGSVLRVSMSLTTGELTLVFRGDDGLMYPIRLGSPEDIMGSDLALRERSRIQIRFALEATSRQCVALQLSTEAQISLRLREENGAALGQH